MVEKSGGLVICIANISKAYKAFATSWFLLNFGIFASSLTFLFVFSGITIMAYLSNVSLKNEVILVKLFKNCFFFFFQI